MQGRHFVVAAGVAGDQVQVGDRDVQLGVLGVGQHQEFGDLIFDFKRGQAQVASDTVIDVHHRRAFAQFGQVLDNSVVITAIGAFFATAALHDALTEQRAFRDQCQRRLVEQQAFVQRGNGDCQAILALDEVQPAVDGFRSQFQTFEQFQQHFPASCGLGGEQHATGKIIEKLRQRCQRLSGLGFDGKVRQRLGREALASGSSVDILLAGDHARPVFQARKAVFHRQEQLGRGQQWPGRIDTAFFVAVAHVVPEVLGGLLDARQGKHLSVLRQVIEQGRGFFEEQRDVVLDTGRRDAAAQVLEDRAAPEVHVEAFAEACLETGDFFFL